jgi:CubicO group peptidase (beta-lactamase class C family)
VSESDPERRRLPAESAPPPAGTAAPAGFGGAALAALQSRIETAIAARRLPGAVLWVERDGVSWSRAFGLRAWEPESEALAADAVYDVASLTKPVVAGALAALLFARGSLALDDPVHEHLPEFGPDAGITVRHLLTHTSGLPAILPLDPAWSGARSAHVLACAAQPTDPPGTSFRYSDINYILLGALIERLGGAGLAELAQHEVLDPLAMHDSGFLPLQRHPPGRLVPTEYDGDSMLRGIVHDPAARRMGGVAGHAGLFATAADVARFARAALADPRFTPMAGNAAPPGLPARGVGWDIDSPYARPRGSVYPRGASFGHTGYTGCAMWIDPASRSFYVFLSNRVHPRGSDSIVALYEEVGTWAARAVGLR